MDDSRRTWAIAGLLGILAASAMGILRLAQSEYRLVIHVKDVYGPVGGVWVAVGEKDILTTNAAGYLEVRGERHELSSALVTVTDSSAEGRHLSQSVFPDVSWNPFQSESVLEISLPLIDSSAAPNFLTLLEPPAQMDSSNGNVPQLEPEGDSYNEAPLQEVELAEIPTELLDSFSEYSLLRPKTQNLTDSHGALFCKFVGFSSAFCASDKIQLHIPPMMARVPEVPVQSAHVTDGNETSHSLGVQTAFDSRQPSVDPGQPSSGDSSQNSVEAKSSTVSIAVFNENTPVQDAYVYMSRMKDSRVIPLGRTSSSGLLSTRVSSQFLGENFTVVHECCAPKKVNPRLLRKDGETYRVNLERGTGFGVLVQQSAYGYLRNNAEFEIHGDSVKLSVSGQDGLAFYDAAKTPDIQLQRVLIRNGLPSEFFTDKKIRQNGLTHILMAGNEPFKPTLALIESEDKQFHKGVLKSSYLRRWRRDFMARLMRLQTVRTQVSSESEARLKLAQVSLSEVRESGWKQTQLSSEWDFLLSVEYKDKDETLELVLSERSGAELLRKNLNVQDTLPEIISRSYFNELVETVPFEAYVLSESEGELELSFAQNKAYGLSAGSRVALYSHELVDSDKLKTVLIGFAEIKKGNGEGLVKAKVTHMDPSFQSASVFPSIVRAVKVGSDFYKTEMSKNSLAVFKKESL